MFIAHRYTAPALLHATQAHTMIATRHAGRAPRQPSECDLDDAQHCPERWKHEGHEVVEECVRGAVAKLQQLPPQQPEVRRLHLLEMLLQERAADQPAVLLPIEIGRLRRPRPRLSTRPVIPLRLPGAVVIAIAIAAAVVVSVGGARRRGDAPMASEHQA